MIQSFNLEEFFEHFRRCTRVITKTWPFIKKNRLWDGFLQNRWVVVVTIISALLFSYFIVEDISNFIQNYFGGNPTGAFFDHADETVKDIKSESKGQAISSGTRYLLLILLEVIIFHFSIKTVNKLRGTTALPTFAEFVKAERRMIILMGIIFVKTWVIHLLLNTFLHMVGLGFMTKVLMIIVHGYYIGYAFFDNYNEQFDVDRIHSQYIIREHFGAVVALGMVIGAMLYLPLLGAIFAPIFGSIAAAIYGNKFQMELTPVTMPPRKPKKTKV